MKLIVVITSIGLNFLLGQRSILYAYNLHNLEENSLNFVELAYFAGCPKMIHGVDMDKSCKESAKVYRKDIEEIFHNKIWKH